MISTSTPIRHAPPAHTMSNWLIRIGFAAFAAAFALVAGCSGTASTTPLPPGSGLVITPGGTKTAQPGWSVEIDPDVQPKKKWTVLVYINGANDLERYGLLNVNQMEQLGSTADVNLVVQFKRIAGRFDFSQGDWGDTRRYYVTRESSDAGSRLSIESPILSRHADLDMGAAANLKQFIQWGVATFPAERYCLVLWNHGSGWRKKELTRGISYDDETGSHIETIEMPDALRHPEGRKWDTLFLDLSLMQMLEVGYEIRETTDLIVGSQESPPGEGLPYDLWVRRLVERPDISARDLSIGTIEDTLARFGRSSNTTQSVIDPSKLPSVVTEINTLGQRLRTAQDLYGPAIAAARSEAESYSYQENKDLIDFLDRLQASTNGSLRIPDPQVQGQVDRVRIAVRQAIVANVNGTRHPRSYGLAAYIPSPREYDLDDIDQANGFGQRFRALAFAEDAPDWHEFLRLGPR